MDYQLSLQTIDDCINWLYAQPRGLKRKDMSFLLQVMSQLNNPEKNLKMIHVAGTNGKGSTNAFMQQILLEHGKNVTRFSSPHLLSILERMQFNGKNISEQSFLKYANIVKSLHLKLSQFEILVIMFILFSYDKKPDYVLIEVGIGGLLDSTNFILPIASVITSIGFDHTDMLGNTLELIAEQKGGIIKEHVPVFLGNMAEEAMLCLQKIAHFKQSQCIIPKWYVEEKQLTLVMNGVTIKPSLIGEHQCYNAQLALTVIAYVLKDNFNIEKAKIGIETTVWRGRMEKINDSPIIYIDGAHNEQGIKILLKNIQHLHQHQKINILFGALARKDYQKMMEKLAHHNLYVTTFNYFQAESVENLLAAAPKQTKSVSNWQLFIDEYQKNEKIPLVITGSLYFISEVVDYFDNYAINGE